MIAHMLQVNAAERQAARWRVGLAFRPLHKVSDLSPVFVRWVAIKPLSVLPLSLFIFPLSGRRMCSYIYSQANLHLYFSSSFVAREGEGVGAGKQGPDHPRDGVGSRVRAEAGYMANAGDGVCCKSGGVETREM